MPSIVNSEILFIINPNSGRRNPSEIINQIKGLDLGIHYIVTKDKQDLEIAFKNSIEKYKVFVAVGGDGTVNEIMKYLINNKDKILGVYPNGSGNGFANELRFGTDLTSLLNDIKNGETIDIDVLSANDNKCINIAGLGFDSFVAHNFQTSTDRGLKNYIISTVKSVFQFKPFDAVLTTSQEEIKGKFQMISIANTRQFGNNAIISPNSQPNDGIFEIVLVKPFPFYLYPVFISKMFLATLKDSEYIRYVTENDFVTIVSDFKKYHLDGEPLLSNGKLKISICKKCIRVIKTLANHME